MGLTLGWIALALAVVPGAPRAERSAGEIVYTVRFVETVGLDWRQAVFTRLTPVTRQGAATVWTAPRDVQQRLIDQAMKDRGAGAKILQTPRVTGRTGSPVHISSRANRQLVTQVAWNGDDHPAAGKPETVRTGSVATMAGRPIDQGVLVQLVLEDTAIRAVHRVPLGRAGETQPKPCPAPPAAQKTASDAGTCTAPRACCQATKVSNASSPSRAFEEWETFGAMNGPCQEASSPTKRASSTAAVWWMDGSLHVNFDINHPHRVPATVTARPVSCPVPAAAPKDASCVNCTGCEEETSLTGTGSTAGPIALEVPEIGSQEIAGEWLIPREGFLLVSFGPHTVVGPDGKALVRERLAIIEAEPSEGASAIPQASRAPTPARISIPVPVPQPPVPEAAASRPIPTPLAKIPMPAPSAPSRSFPQGFHADGRPADLPPLPPDEAEETPSDSDSSEPRPSAQSKKPRQSRPATDSGMNKVEFTVPSFPALPSLFVPAPSVGLQFLVPLKPFSLQLPFNRRLEIEVFGRVVRNATTGAPERSPQRGAVDDKSE